jgi:hypothetical protein
MFRRICPQASNPPVNEFEFRGDVQQAILLPPTGADRDAFRVVAIDIYEDGVGVRWAAPAPPQPMTPEEMEAAAKDFYDAAFPDVKLADNEGNEYAHVENGAGSSDDVMRGETIFNPLSPTARRLTVYADGREFGFDLSQALRRG